MTVVRRVALAAFYVVGTALWVALMYWVMESNT